MQCPKGSAEAKSAACVFLACWSIAQAGFWIDPSGINKALKTSGNSHVLGYTSRDLSLH